MARRGAPGLGVQVAKALKVISGRGISKHETKREYMAQQRKTGERINPLASPLIHSDKYRTNIQQTSEQYLRWARQNGYGAKLIKDFNHEEAGRKWFEHRISLGIKDLRTEAGHLAKLSNGIKKTWGVDVKIVPDDLTLQLKKANYPTTKEGKIAQQTNYRRYTPAEVARGLEIVKGQRFGGLAKAKALEGQTRLGFRVQEAVCLRVAHVNLDKGYIHIQEGMKGTITRYVPIPEDYKDTLKDLMDGKALGDRVYDIRGKKIENKIRNMQRAWEIACEKMGIQEHKTHNLRAFYACERLEELKEQIRIERFLDLKDDVEREVIVDREARDILIRELGHRDTTKLAHYIR